MRKISFTLLGSLATVKNSNNNIINVETRSQNLKQLGLGGLQRYLNEMKYKT